MKRKFCPACVHKETIKAREHDRERHDDDEADFCWSPGPTQSGACGNPGMPGKYHRGVWECRICGLRLTCEEAAILLDAALTAGYPGCDSFGGVMYLDARDALKGGRG